MSIALYWHTVSHLRPEQAVNRVALVVRRSALCRARWMWRLVRRYQIPKALTERAVAVDLGPAAVHRLLAPQGRLAVGGDDPAYSFTFMNRTLSFQGQVDWTPATSTLLWKYYLHAFEYGYALGVQRRAADGVQAYQHFRALVTQWYMHNPPAGTVGWDPYPTSLRIVNWIKAYGFFAADMATDPAFHAPFLESLYLQALYLEHSVEHHLLNNHIVENARALLLAGLLFEGDRRGRRWAEKGQRILWRELRRQVSPDGTQYELSPMYHAAVLLACADARTALRARGRQVPPWVESRLGLMVRHLQMLCHPDGEMALLNDAALGMVPAMRDVLEALGQMGIIAPASPVGQSSNAAALPSSGLCIYRDEGRGAYLVFDGGPLGPDYQPGHGHCDTLSYEWSFHGRRVIVDSGVEDYYRGDGWRAYYRGTSAHNTIIVDGQEQSEIWGNFRVGRRAHPLPMRCEAGQDMALFAGGHDGYRRLRGRVIHSRYLALVGGSVLIAFDWLAGMGEHEAESLVHLHPRLEARLAEGDAVLLAHDRMDCFALLPFGFDGTELIKGRRQPTPQGWYAPEFGIRLENWVAALSWHGSLPHGFGYCLVPVNDPDQFSLIALRAQATADGYRVHLHTADGDRSVLCSRSGIQLLHTSYRAHRCTHACGPTCTDARWRVDC